MIDRYVRLSDLEDMLENSQTISDGEFSGYCTEDIRLSKLKVQDVMPVIHAYWIECKTGFKCSNCKARENAAPCLTERISSAIVVEQKWRGINLMSLVMFDMLETPKCCTWTEPGARKYCPAFDPYLHMCRVLNDYPPYDEHYDERSAKCPIVDVLPVRIGTQVWQVMSDTIREGKVSMLQQKADGTWKFRVSFPGSGGVYDYKVSDIGKCEDCSIHLSKAMAERALLRLSHHVEE